MSSQRSTRSKSDKNNNEKSTSENNANNETSSRADDHTPQPNEQSASSFPPVAAAPLAQNNADEVDTFTPPTGILHSTSCPTVDEQAATSNVESSSLKAPLVRGSISDDSEDEEPPSEGMSRSSFVFVNANSSSVVTGSNTSENMRTTASDSAGSVSYVNTHVPMGMNSATGSSYAPVNAPFDTQAFLMQMSQINAQMVQNMGSTLMTRMEVTTRALLQENNERWESNARLLEEKHQHEMSQLSATVADLQQQTQETLDNVAAALQHVQQQVMLDMQRQVDQLSQRLLPPTVVSTIVSSSAAPATSAVESMLPASAPEPRSTQPQYTAATEIVKEEGENDAQWHSHEVADELDFYEEAQQYSDNEEWQEANTDEASDDWDNRELRGPFSAPPKPPRGPFSGPLHGTSSSVTARRGPFSGPKSGSSNGHSPVVHASVDTPIAMVPLTPLPQKVTFLQQASKYGSWDLATVRQMHRDLSPTEEELQRYGARSLPLPYTTSRIRGYSTYLCGAYEGTEFPPVQVREYQDAFFRVYTKLALSGEPDAGQGLFLSRTLPERVTLMYEGYLTRTEPSEQDGPYSLLARGTELQRDRIWIVGARNRLPTSRVNALLEVGSLSVHKLNVRFLSNGTGAMSVQVPARIGLPANTELLTRYAPDYPWFLPVYEPLLQSLIDELEYLRQPLSSACTQQVLRPFAELSQVRRLLDELTRRQLYRGDMSTKGLCAAFKVSEFKEVVPSFCVLWGVVTKTYRGSTQAAQAQQFPYGILSHGQFCAYFTFGLAKHSRYAKYDRVAMLKALRLVHFEDADDPHVIAELEDIVTWSSSPYYALWEHNGGENRQYDHTQQVFMDESELDPSPPALVPVISPNSYAAKVKQSKINAVTSKVSPATLAFRDSSQPNDQVTLSKGSSTQGIFTLPYDLSYLPANRQWVMEGVVHMYPGVPSEYLRDYSKSDITTWVQIKFGVGMAGQGVYQPIEAVLNAVIMACGPRNIPHAVVHSFLSRGKLYHPDVDVELQNEASDAQSRGMLGLALPLHYKVPASIYQSDEARAALQALIMHLCSKYRKKKDHQAILSSIYALQLPTSHLRGITDLFHDYSRLYFQLSVPERQAQDIVEVMKKAIRRGVKAAGKDTDAAHQLVSSFLNHLQHIPCDANEDKLQHMTRVVQRIEDMYKNDDDDEETAKVTTAAAGTSKKTAISIKSLAVTEDGTDAMSVIKQAIVDGLAEGLKMCMLQSPPGQAVAVSKTGLSDSSKNRDKFDGCYICGCAKSAPDQHLQKDCPYQKPGADEGKAAQVDFVKVAALEPKKRDAVWADICKNGRFHRSSESRIRDHYKPLFDAACAEADKKRKSTKLSNNSCQLKQMSVGVLPSGALAEVDPSTDDGSNAVAERLCRALSGRASNQYLNHHDYKVRRIRVGDEKFETVQSQCVPLDLLQCAVSTSQVRGMSDGGAAMTLCSTEFVKQHGLHVFAAGEYEFEAFDSHTTTILPYQQACFILEISGVDVNTHQPTVFQLFVRAVILQQLSMPLLLGSDFLHAHGVVTDHGRRLTTFVCGNSQLQVPWVPFSRAEQQLVVDQHSELQVNASKLVTQSCNASQPFRNSVSTHVNAVQEWDPNEVRQWSKLTAVEKTIEQPVAFLNHCRAPFTAFAAIGLTILCSLYGLVRLMPQVAILDRSTLDHASKQLPIHSPTFMQTLPLEQQAATVNALTLCHSVVNMYVHEASRYAVLQNDLHVTPNSGVATPRYAADASVAPPEFLNGTEYVATNPYADCLGIVRIGSVSLIPEPVTPSLSEEEQLRDLLASECQHLQPELRPAKFPEHLWPYVADSQKPLVKERFAKFPDERLDECIASAMKDIRIYTGTEARKAQEPLFRAQALANIDCFYHVNPDNPPTIPGAEFEIRLKDPNKPPVSAKQRRRQPLETVAMNRRCDKMVREGKLRPSRSAYSNPVHMVANPERIKDFHAKHEGEDPAVYLHCPQTENDVIGLYRMTMDMRDTNSNTWLEHFPLPRIQNLHDMCNQFSNRYSAGDIADAFFCISMKEESRHITAFSTPTAHLEYCVMPQGVKSAATVWARTIAGIFVEELHRYPLIVYQDDVVNGEKPLLAHYRLQQATYDRMRLNFIVFKPVKTTINFPDQKLLGHVMSEQGRRADPGLIRTIAELAPPRNLTDVQSLLGLAKVATDYVPGLASILAPIQALAKKGIDVKASWQQPQIEAFAELKVSLTTAPVLMIANIYKPFRLHVDACRVGRGIGAVLMQQDPKDETKWHPVAYYSRALQDAERKFSATELELTGLHDSILHWRPYLYGTCHDFEVFADHYALVYMVTKMGGTAHSHQRLTRLCLDLQGYSFSVTHRKGTEHLDADAVSRLLLLDDVPYVFDEYTLVDGTGPLSDMDRRDLGMHYNQPLNDEFATSADWIAYTTNKFRKERLEEQTALAINSFAIATEEFEPLPTKVEQLMCKCVQVCSECSVTAPVNGSITEHTTELPAHSTIPFRPSAYDIEHMSTRRIDLALSDPQQHLYKPERAIYLYTYLHVLANRAVCPHNSTGASHDTEFPECKSRLIRTLRSSNLRLLQKFHDESHMTAFQLMNVNSELSRRRLATPTAPASTKKQRRRHRLRLHQDPLAINAGRVKAAAPVTDDTAEAELPPIPIAAHDTRRARAVREEEEARRQEILDNRMEKYHYLHQQHYMDPTSQQLYQIIDTKMVRRSTRKGGPIVYTVAWPVSSINQADQEKSENWQELELATVLPLIQAMTDIVSPLNGTKFPTSPTEWIDQQAQDEVLGPLLERLSENDGNITVNLCKHPERDANHFDYIYRPRMSNGELGPITRAHALNKTVRLGNIEHTTFQKHLQLVVPSEMVPVILHQMHEQMGHAGPVRTYRTVREKYWWPTLVVDCKSHCAKCHHCGVRKANNRVAIVPVQEYPAPPYPHHTAAVDLCGPFPLSKGHAYILVYKCALTKWVEIVALKNKTAESVVAELAKIFLRFGAPRHLLTDRGREFSNDMITRVCTMLETHHTRITPANPRANGLAENMMRTLKDVLSAHVNNTQSNWSEHLHAVAHVYNTTVNHATNYTPYYLNFGRACASPDIDYYLPQLKNKDLDEYSIGLRDTLSLAWAGISGNAWSDKTVRYNTRPSKPLAFKPYEVNQLVFIKRIPRRFYKSQTDEEEYNISAKLQPRYSGPYRITAVISDVLYEAQVHGKTRRLHAINMKPAQVFLNVADPEVGDDDSEDEFDPDDAHDEEFDAEEVAQQLLGLQQGDK